MPSVPHRRHRVRVETPGIQVIIFSPKTTTEIRTAYTPSAPPARRGPVPSGLRHGTPGNDQPAHTARFSPPFLKQLISMLIQAFGHLEQCMYVSHLYWFVLRPTAPHTGQVKTSFTSAMLHPPFLKHSTSRARIIPGNISNSSPGHA